METFLQNNDKLKIYTACWNQVS